MLAFVLASVAIMVMLLLPFARIAVVAKLPVGPTVTALPLTVTESIPLASVAVPTTVISFMEKVWPFVGWVTINNGGAVSDNNATFHVHVRVSEPLALVAVATTVWVPALAFVFVYVEVVTLGFVRTTTPSRVQLTSAV